MRRLRSLGRAVTREIRPDCADRRGTTCLRPGARSVARRSCQRRRVRPAGIEARDLARDPQRWAPGRPRGEIGGTRNSTRAARSDPQRATRVPRDPARAGARARATSSRSTAPARWREHRDASAPIQARGRCAQRGVAEHRARAERPERPQRRERDHVEALVRRERHRRERNERRAARTGRAAAFAGRAPPRRADRREPAGRERRDLERLFTRAGSCGSICGAARAAPRETPWTSDRARARNRASRSLRAGRPMRRSASCS